MFNKTVLKVGFFLALRQIRRASLWTTLLIILVMTLTFLNLVVVNGVLVGLIESSISAERTAFTGDVFVTNLKQKTFIEHSQNIIDVAQSLKGVQFVSGRYVAGGKLNADYLKKLSQNEVPNSAPASIAGIDPVIENQTTGLSKYVIEGKYLAEDDVQGILIGADLLYRYTPVDSSSFQSLKGIYPGDRLKLSIGNNSEEVIVRGIIKSKIGENDARVFMNQNEVRKLIANPDSDYNEIAIKMVAGSSDSAVQSIKQVLINNNFDDGATVQTYVEAQPKFLKDIQTMFDLLGNMIGSIGIAVASITIFIVIFVNTITRRKFIGILKGIGIDSRAIEISYIIQSIFYALAGSGVGFVLLYAFLMPFVDAHPINFPFSNGTIYAPVSGTLIRGAILLLTTVIAGYIPARMIVKKNTLDSILGR